MTNICLSCVEVVGEGEGINPNYNGMRIHYGQDWYCGPVIEVSEQVQESTLKFLIDEKKEKDWLLEFFCTHDDTDWENYSG